MSDYFAALLRSSGIATPHAAGAVRPVVERTAPAEAPPVEQSVSLQASDATGEPASQPSLARAPLAVQPATAHIASEPASMPRPTIPADLAGNAPTVSAESTAAPPDTISAEAQSDASQPPLSRALIDAALRWVAAGEQPDRDHPRTQAHEPVPTFAEPSGHLASRPSTPAQPPGAPIALAHPVAAATVTHERSAAMLPPLRSETTSHLSDVIAAAIDRDPPLDISIGAIHVRVDAPAAQTVTQPSAPRPVVAPRAAPGRSALARRALRRI
jgi:hypothetical protein